ncbi:hypothetical protein V4D30_02765 [Thermodesulfovibrio sp. 3907-1M]|uniref:DUF8196 domain-containing protein n=1 Tax=Thermodesulfovibrio autotrophicus TaxID=3118333 RepID=A0AAU8H074_9BACT
MATVSNIKDKIKKVFPVKQASVLLEVVDIVNETVKVKDFNELKEIVRDLAQAQKELAEAQKQSESRLSRLETAVAELTEAQKRTEQRLEELADAQKRTEQRLEELADAQKRTEEEVATLAKGLRQLRKEVGGLSLTMSYAFENESYRMLPKFLKENYGIEIKEKLIRAEIGGKEINIFGKARKNGKEVFIVGESKLRLDERKEQSIEDVFNELEEKVKAVQDEYGKVDVLRVLITHYATKGFQKKAKSRGIIIVQSFEW